MVRLPTAKIGRILFVRLTIDGLGDYTGTGSGSFFGPNAEEVGGIFSANRGANGALAGVFFGLRDDSITDPNAPFGTLAGLTGTQEPPFFALESFGFTSDVVGFRFNNETGLFEVDLLPGGSDQTDTVAWTPADASDVQPIPALDEFITEFQGNDIRLRVPSSTPTVELTYASFAEISRPDFPAPNFDDRAFLVYGLQTRQMPRTGTGSYSGITLASAEVRGETGTDFFLVNGSSLLTADFGAGTFDLLLSNLVGTFEDDRGVGRRTTFDGNFDDIQYSGGINGNELQASGLFNGNNFQGGFYGPNADEFAAVFSRGISGVSDIAIRGVAAGVRD